MMTGVRNSVEFRASAATATCLDCKATFTPTRDGRFEVTPHLRERHGFAGEIEFEIVSEIICPRMQHIRATDNG